MRALVLLVAVLAATEAVGPGVEMKVVTSGGSIAFRVESEWPVVASRSVPPLTVLAFQLPNPADAGTPDSTNLAVSVLQLGSEDGKAAFARLPALVEAEPKRERIDAWEVFRQKGKQDATTYTIVDAKRAFRHGGVVVRLAWPHLPDNPADYDARMERTLRALLASVREHVDAP